MKIVIAIFLVVNSFFSIGQNFLVSDTAITFEDLFNMGIKEIKYENNIIEYDDSCIVNNFNFENFSSSKNIKDNKKKDKYILFYNKKKLIKITWIQPNNFFYTNIYIKENERFYIYCLQIVIKKTKETKFYPHFVINDKNDSTNFMIGFAFGFSDESKCYIKENDRLSYGINDGTYVLIGLDCNLNPKTKVSFIENYIAGASEIKNIKNGIVEEFYGVPIPSIMKRYKLSEKINNISYHKIKNYFLDGILFNCNHVYVKYRVKYYLNCFYYLNFTAK